MAWTPDWMTERTANGEILNNGWYTETLMHASLCLHIVRLLFLSVQKLSQCAKSAFEFQIIPVKPF